MSRKEQLQNEHQGRVDRMRMESPLPSRVIPQRRWSMRGMVLIFFIALVLVGVAAWYVYGGK
jgi:hypothetical protein